MTAPYDTLRQLIDGYRISQMICVAAELGIADLLANGPKPCARGPYIAAGRFTKPGAI